MSVTVPYRQARIYLTPRVSPLVYGPETEVTDFVKDRKIGKIKKELDNGDFVFGVFTLNSVKVTLINDGRFSLYSYHPQSIFFDSRDLCRVRITFDSGTEETEIFRGLIDENATKEKTRDNIIDFVVLSENAIFRKRNVASGIVTQNSLFSTAISRIVESIPERRFSFSEQNVSVDFDRRIGNPNWFVGRGALNALNRLFLATNSVGFINSDNEFIVSSRQQNSPRIVFFNNQIGGDILAVKHYNSGRHRAFNIISVNGELQARTAFDPYYSANEFSSITLPFVTDLEVSSSIAQNLVNKFSVPKQEITIVIPLERALNISLLDSVSLDIRPNIFPATGTQALPKYGSARYSSARYPVVNGLGISRRTAWYVLAITLIPSKMVAYLKLREQGISFTDGIFVESTGIYGLSLYGEANYSEENTYEPFRNANYGIGKYGQTDYND